MDSVCVVGSSPAGRHSVPAGAAAQAVGQGQDAQPQGNQASYAV